jgi:thioesterase domain-containing protein
MNGDCRYLKEYLYQHIPLSQALGLEVIEASLENIVLGAPFLPNINHKHTVFGGSLHALSTLACWSLNSFKPEIEDFFVNCIKPKPSD